VVLGEELLTKRVKMGTFIILKRRIGLEEIMSVRVACLCKKERLT